MSIQSKNHHGHYGQSSRNSFAYEKLITHPCCFLKPTTIFFLCCETSKTPLPGHPKVCAQPGNLKIQKRIRKLRYTNPLGASAMAPLVGGMVEGICAFLVVKGPMIRHFLQHHMSLVQVAKERLLFGV